jgi:hypothetical protein
MIIKATFKQLFDYDKIFLEKLLFYLKFLPIFLNKKISFKLLNTHVKLYSFGIIREIFLRSMST